MASMVLVVNLMVSMIVQELRDLSVTHLMHHVYSKECVWAAEWDKIK